MLLLDLLGWDIDKVDRLEDIARIRAAIVFIGDRVTATEQAKAAISAAKNSKTVVLVGGSPAGTANNFLSLESVYYLETPLDIAALERLIQNVS